MVRESQLVAGSQEPSSLWHDPGVTAEGPYFACLQEFRYRPPPLYSEVSCLHLFSGLLGDTFDGGRVWWHRPVVPVLGRLRQEDRKTQVTPSWGPLTACSLS